MRDRSVIAAALALTTAGVLTLEVMLSRLLSVVTWYSVGFLVLSLAMLGLTAGGLYVHRKPGLFAPERLRGAIARACAWTAGLVPVAVAGCLAIPIPLVPSLTTLAAVLTLAVLIAAPFAAAGVVVGAALTRTPGRVGVLYAVDMVGSAAGCLLAFPLLDHLDAPSAILVAASLPAAGAAVVFSDAPRRAAAGAGAAALVILGVANASAPWGLRLTYVKGMPEIGVAAVERWNTFSRVRVEPARAQFPFYWGASPRAPRELARFAAMAIDGEAGTPLILRTDRRSLDYLRYDVTAVGHFFRPERRACVIGVGGGRDVAAALVFGHPRVLGIEMNPIFVELLRTPPFPRSNALARDRRVSLVNEEGRSYLARRSDLRCRILVASLVDTWAATGAGALVLGENGLYTVESFALMLSRVERDGVLSVSRWYAPSHVDETSRLLALGSAALMHLGERDTRRNLVLYASGGVATLLAFRRPLSEAEIGLVHDVATLMGYRVIASPDMRPEDPLVRAVVEAQSLERLAGVARTAPIDVSPPEDDRPFFFHMLRLSDWTEPSRIFAMADGAGMVRGNVAAVIALGVLGLVVALLTALCIVVPLRTLDAEARAVVPLARRRAIAAFFALTGCGFMVVEVGLVQRLGVYLGHPIYSLGVVLFGIILFTGAGAALSELASTRRQRWIVPLVAGLIVIAIATVVGSVTAAMAGADTFARIAIALLLVALVGLALGLQFPTGIAAVRRIAPSLAAFGWGVSGAAGVLGSVLAVTISLHYGITATLGVGAALYLVAAWPLAVLVRAADARDVDHT